MKSANKSLFPQVVVAVNRFEGTCQQLREHFQEALHLDKQEEKRHNRLFCLGCLSLPSLMIAFALVVVNTDPNKPGFFQSLMTSTGGTSAGLLIVTAVVAAVFFLKPPSQPSKNLDDDRLALARTILDTVCDKFDPQAPLKMLADFRQTDEKEYKAGGTEKAPSFRQTWLRLEVEGYRIEVEQHMRTEKQLVRDSENVKRSVWLRYPTELLRIRRPAAGSPEESKINPETSDELTVQKWEPDGDVLEIVLISNEGLISGPRPKIKTMLKPDLTAAILQKLL